MRTVLVIDSGRSAGVLAALRRELDREHVELVMLDRPSVTAGDLDCLPLVAEALSRPARVFDLLPHFDPASLVVDEPCTPAPRRGPERPVRPAIQWRSPCSR